MPTAETLRCPSCGAATSTDSAKCQFCGARLATVACPSCFGMMFVGERFCSHCGAVARRNELPPSGKLSCCDVPSGNETVQIGKTQIWECGACEGMWLDAATLQQICTESEQQAAVLGMPSVATTPASLPLNFAIGHVPFARL